jgi:4-hydroxy-3-polyprenylbenzoate decarboxylase
MNLALEVESLDQVADRIRAFMDVKSPQGFLDKVKMLPMLAEMGKFFPKTVSTGPCKEVIKRDNFSLLDFPILQCWPKDAGSFITLPCVVSRDPKNGKRNVGMYRMQIYDERTTGMHWQRQKVGAEHYREALRAAAQVDVGASVPARASAAVDIMARSSGGSILIEGERLRGKMEVAVAIGTDPAITFSAIVPAPPDVEEYLIAGFLRQKPVELVKCETVDLEVPAAAEIVLEGHVHLDELRAEGPFGDHTGYYSLEDLYPVFHLSCITHRKNPIYSTTIVGKPPMEDGWMGKAVERIFLPLMRLTIPELVDINLLVEGVFYNLMLVSIRKSYPGQARKVMNAILSLGGHVHEVIIVVDEDERERTSAGHAQGVESHRPGARYSVHSGPGRFAGPFLAAAQRYARRWGLTPRANGQAKGFARPWPTKS